MDRLADAIQTFLSKIRYNYYRFINSSYFLSKVMCKMQKKITVNLNNSNYNMQINMSQRLKILLEIF